MEYGLSSAVSKSGSEIPAIENFVDFVVNNAAGKFTHLNGKHLRLRAAKIHQKPYALLNRRICNRSRVEFGDILFVVKRKMAESIIDYRCSFAQAKLYRNSWTIEPHQFEFLTHLPSIQFNLARAYQSNGTSFRLSTYSDWASTYLLMSNAFCLSIPPIDLRRFYATKCRSFRVDCCLLGAGSSLIGHCPRWAFRHFVLKFLANHGVGAKVKGRLRNLVEICYEIVGLTPDPPNDFETEKGAFAVIEFEISENQ